MTCNKDKLQDIKDENDQCLLEIERLQKKIEELELKVDVLQSKNNSQAKILMSNISASNKKYFAIMPKKQDTYK
jgi:uncharacterized protein YlxW (UPF0749 family)